MNLHEVLAELEKLDTYDIEDDPMCGMFSNYRTMVKQVGKFRNIGDYVLRTDMIDLMNALIERYGDR